MDRAGSSRIATAERRNFHHPMFSPDGRRLALDFTSIEGRNVWILGLDEGTLTRASFDRDGHDATWTPDGRAITYITPIGGCGRRDAGAAQEAAHQRRTAGDPARVPAAVLHRSLAAGRQRAAHDHHRARQPAALPPTPPTRTRERTSRSCATGARDRSSAWSPAPSRSGSSVLRRTAARSPSSRTSRAATRCICATSPASRTRCSSPWRAAPNRCGARWARAVLPRDRAGRSVSGRGRHPYQPDAGGDRAESGSSRWTTSWGPTRTPTTTSRPTGRRSSWYGGVRRRGSWCCRTFPRSYGGCMGSGRGRPDHPSGRCTWSGPGTLGGSGARGRPGPGRVSGRGGGGDSGRSLPGLRSRSVS